MRTNKIKETSLILKPSEGKGIGVFAIEDIEKGKRIYWERKRRFIPKKKITKDKILTFMCNTYGVEKKDSFECPPDFQRMSLIWFLNHSEEPNLTAGKTFYFTTRKIRKGEELTINYRNLDEPNQEYLKNYK